MNAIRFWGLVAVFLAPALAQQTYFPDQGNFTFEQTSVGDWLEIQYSYTNPGGWQRDDAGAEVDWNLFDNPLMTVASTGGIWAARRPSPVKKLLASARTLAAGL